MVVHLVYVKGNSISTPCAITNELSKRLTEKFDLKIYDWDERGTIQPEEGDILIGHPHPERNTIYRNSFWKQGWKRKILMNPFAHAMPEYISFFDDLVIASDHYLAICGKYWIDTLDTSLVSHWKPWIEHLDLAVDTKNFPFIKKHFNPAGKRKFLYIGHTAKYKGCDYLGTLADSNPGLEIGWIGSGDSFSIKVNALGKMDFSNPASLELLSDYDFLLHCGRSDANPTTILEAAAWGLIPVCTPQSGYYGEDWFVNIPLDDPQKALSILEELNHLPETQLLGYQNRAKSAIAQKYNWDRFAGQVENCLVNCERKDANTALVENRKLFTSNRRMLRKLENQKYWQTVTSKVKNKISNLVG